MIDASVTNVLRTSLSKNVTDTTLNPAPLTVPQDTEKLKKHIALVCDRLGRGAKLTEGVSRRLFYLPLVVRLLEFPSWPKYLFTWLFVTVLRHCWLDDGKDIRPVKAGC